MITLPRDFLRGSYPPLITPFRGEEIDYGSFRSLVSSQVEHGSHGIVIGSTSGEPASLTQAERKQLLETALEVVGKRIPVIAATGTQSYADTLDLTQHAEKAGADALLIVTPYFNKPPQRGVVAYYLKLAEHTKLPFLISHVPGHEHLGVTLETVHAIADRAQHFVGIKHAVNDLGYVAQLVDEMGEEFRIFAGLEELSFPMLAIGACGVMNAVGNIAPRRISRLYERTMAGDLATARRMHHELAELNASVFWDTNPIPIKYMMRRLGMLVHNDHRLPMVPADAELARRLDGVLERANLIDQVLA